MCAIEKNSSTKERQSFFLSFLYYNKKKGAKEIWDLIVGKRKKNAKVGANYWNKPLASEPLRGVMIQKFRKVSSCL